MNKNRKRTIRRLDAMYAGVPFVPRYNWDYKRLRGYLTTLAKVAQYSVDQRIAALRQLSPYTGRGHGRQRFGLRSVANKPLFGRSKYSPHPCTGQA